MRIALRWLARAANSVVSALPGWLAITVASQWWRRGDGRIELAATVPDNTEAEIRVPTQGRLRTGRWPAGGESGGPSGDAVGQGAMSHCWQTLSSWAHWRTTVPLAVPQFATSRVMPLFTLVIV